jgi:hypothetical protein
MTPDVDGACRGSSPANGEMGVSLRRDEAIFRAVGMNFENRSEVSRT